ncbi:Acyl-coenzyme A oxidase 3, peroxisomal [Linum grandiflorum]
MSSESSSDRASRRTRIISNHLTRSCNHPNLTVDSNIRSDACLSYTPPELREEIRFDVKQMRELLDAHNLEDRDWLFGLMAQSELFRGSGRKEFLMPDFNQTKEQQREATMKRIEYFRDKGAFDGWFATTGPEIELWRFALAETLGVFDQSLYVKVGVHFYLWGGAIQFLGTKRHHDKWLKDTETYRVKGCFAMTELGHGSNVRGIETVATYDANTNEFIINTPCESAQKYWIGGAADHATHTVVFSQLEINGTNEGVHAFIVRIRDDNGDICSNIRIADCGHKIGLNGVDNGRIWFDNVRIPRENLLNSVADVTPDGRYESAIQDPDQRFAAFMAPLTSGRVIISSAAVYSAQTGLAIAIRYALTRRAFSFKPDGPEVLLLDYPSHQRRLLPLLAKTYAMSFARNYLKNIYVKRTPESLKLVHVVSSGFKAALTWHNMRTLQECREACGGQGLKTENQVGHLKGEYDVQSTFEGDNNVLMQQVSKALLGEYIAASKKKSKAFSKGLRLEHMNEPLPVVPSKLTSDTLRSSHFQITAFRLRERDLLNRFAAEMSRHRSNGVYKDYAFALGYQLAEDLGRAYSDRIIYETFLEGEGTVSTSPLKEVLGQLRSLYALTCMDEDASFLRYGYLTTENATSVRAEVAKLCSEIRPNALGLVSSFGIPNGFLSPIAFDWIHSNSWSSSDGNF